jgi:chromosomal replication initiator protein
VDKEEILSKFPISTRSFLEKASFEFLEESVVIKTFDSYLKEKIIPDILPQLTAIVGKKIYVVLEKEPEQDKKTTNNSNSNQNEAGKIFGDRETLDPFMTLDRLVIGSFNQEAVEAVDNLIIDKKGGIVTIWGGSGLGKSHLLQAAGWKFYKASKFIYFIESTRFVDMIVQSAKNKNLDSLHASWDLADVLLFDDLQVIAKLSQSIPLVESELFNLITRFSEENKKIIFVSDRSPVRMPFDTRITYRLALSQHEIKRPDKETRKEILKNYFSEKKRVIQDKHIDMLAQNLNQNIRQLIGVVNFIDVRMEFGLIDDETVNLAIHMMSPSIKGTTDPIEEIVSTVTTYMGVEKNTLLEKRAKSRPRILAIAATRLLHPEISVEKIANFFNCSRKAVYEIAAREAKADDLAQIMSLVKE